MDSATLYEQLQITYKQFGQSYENVLAEYYSKQMDVMKHLYVEQSRFVKGIILIDGTFEIGLEQLTELFTTYSTCFAVCVCLMPEERKQISSKDMTKVIHFENLSIMRYLSHFFNWLINVIPINTVQNNRSDEERIVVYNNTLYTNVKYWLREHGNLFHLVFTVEHLQNTIENLQGQ